MDVPEIDIAEAVRRWGAGTPIVDVREPHEWVEVHVSGAMLIPLGDVADRLEEIPTDGEVLIICKVGVEAGEPPRSCDPWVSMPSTSPGAPWPGSPTAIPWSRATRSRRDPASSSRGPSDRA